MNFFITVLVISFGVSFAERPTTCPAGYQTIQSMCFAVIRVSVSWPSAQSMCDAFGGDVLEVDSSMAMSTVVGLFNQAHDEVFWMDASDVMTPGTWRFSGRDARALSFTKWDAGEPAGNPGTRCATIKPGTDAWVAKPCGDNAMVICQIKLADDSRTIG